MQYTKECQQLFLVNHNDKTFGTDSGQQLFVIDKDQRYESTTLLNDMKEPDTARHDTTRHDTTRHDMT